MNILELTWYFLFALQLCEAFAPLSKTSVLESRRRIIGNQHHVLFASSDDKSLEEIQEIVGLTDAELKRIVSRIPEVGDYPSGRAKICVEKLKTRLSLTDLEFKKKIVLRLPQCLGYDFETEIDPSLSLLQTSLDMSDDELRSFVLKCPQIIGLDFSTEVEPKLNALSDTIDGVSLKEQILQKPASLDLAVRGGVTPSKKTSS